MDKEELTKIFADLGADEPESWAESEVEEGIPQLARYLFLKGCWDGIVSDDDGSWIDVVIGNTPEDSTDPFSGTAHALRRLLAAGASRNDICQVVRGMQAEFLHHVCYQLDDSDSVAGNEYVTWGLTELDEDGQPIRLIDGLHESVFETDPTGREMRPRSS